MRRPVSSRGRSEEGPGYLVCYVLHGVFALCLGTIGSLAESIKLIMAGGPKRDLSSGFIAARTSSSPEAPSSNYSAPKSQISRRAHKGESTTCGDSLSGSPERTICLPILGVKELTRLIGLDVLSSGKRRCLHLHDYRRVQRLAAHAAGCPRGTRARIGPCRSRRVCYAGRHVPPPADGRHDWPI